MRWSLYLLLVCTGCGAGQPAPHRWVDGNEDSRVSAVWVGHATVLLEMDGTRVLTDPNLGDRLFFLPRDTPAATGMPPAHVAVVSHLHFDHFDRPTLMSLPPSTRLVFPADSEAYTRNLEHPRAYLGSWQSAQVGRVKITAVPVAHFGGRYGPDILWNRSYTGYVIETPSAVVYFGGDGGLDEDQMKEVALRWPRIDLALLPIAPYRGDSGNAVHMDPAEALSAFDLLNARYMIPIHYEAYYGMFGNFSKPRRKLTGEVASRGLEPKVFALRVGDRWELTRSGTPQVLSAYDDEPSDISE